ARKGLGVNPKDGISWMQLAYYIARAGDSTDIDAAMKRALQLAADDPNVRYYAALIALERGDRAAALDSLSHAMELGYPGRLIRPAPDFASLRTDARFRELLAQADRPPSG